MKRLRFSDMSPKVLLIHIFGRLLKINLFTYELFDKAGSVNFNNVIVKDPNELLNLLRYIVILILL